MEVIMIVNYKTINNNIDNPYHSLEVSVYKNTNFNLTTKQYYMWLIFKKLFIKKYFKKYQIENIFKLFS
jgi:hypothetical protein